MIEIPLQRELLNREPDKDVLHNHNHFEQLLNSIFISLY